MNQIQRIAIAILATLVFSSQAPAQSVLCPKSRIEGCDRQYDRAKELLPPVTLTKEASIYVTKMGDSLYLHSNFKPSADFEFPIKILTNETRDLELLASNILTFGGQVEVDFEVYEAHRQSVRYIIDHTIFDSSGKLDLDLMGAENVHVIFDGENKPRKLSEVPSARGPPKWVVEWADNVFVRVNGAFQPSELFSKMQSRPFRENDFNLVSLFMDTAVEKTIDASTLQSHELKLDKLSRKSLEEAFAKSKNKILGLLGHVEDGSFVTRSPDGATELIRISLVDVQELAEKHGTDVVYLGCNSAIDSPVGANRAFNPVFAIKQLETAVQATNLYDFLSRLTSPSLGMVLEEVAFAGFLRTPKSANFSGIEKEPTATFDRIDFTRAIEVGAIGVYFGGGGDVGGGGPVGDGSGGFGDGSDGPDGGGPGDTGGGGGDGNGAPASDGIMVDKSDDEEEDSFPLGWILGVVGVITVAAIWKMRAGHA